MAQAIAVQPYVMVERAVKHQAQTTTVKNYELHLFETKITSFQREFSIRHVYDMSFKIISGQEGFLYLHTNEGVYSYRVMDNPEKFITAYRNLR